MHLLVINDFLVTYTCTFKVIHDFLVTYACTFKVIHLMVHLKHLNQDSIGICSVKGRKCFI